MVVVMNPSEGKPSMGKFIRDFAAGTRLGRDLAKTVFQIHAVDAKGEVVVARKLTRGRIVPLFAELPPRAAAMEARVRSPRTAAPPASAAACASARRRDRRNDA